MNYSVTVTGLIVILLGIIGLGDIIPEEEVASVVNGVLEVGGIILSWWGRYRQGDISPLGMKK